MKIKGILLRIILSIEFFAILPMLAGKVTDKKFFYSLSELLTLILSIFVILASVFLATNSKDRNQQDINEDMHSLISEIILFFIFLSANVSVYFVGWIPLLIYLFSKFMIVTLIIKFIRIQIRENQKLGKIEK